MRRAHGSSRGASRSSPHDALGSNLVVQVKNDRVLRVLPLENEAINECWISDKDRFSYEALGSEDRLAAPMITDGGEWKTVDWQTALKLVAGRLRETVAKHGAAALGTLVSPHSTLEEMALAAKLTRALGSDNIDFRLRQTDFRGDGQGTGIPWLGLAGRRASTRSIACSSSAASCARIIR